MFDVSALNSSFKREKNTVLINPTSLTVWQPSLSCKSLLSYVCIDFSLGTWVEPLQARGDIPVVMRLLMINTRQTRDPRPVKLLLHTNNYPAGRWSAIKLTRQLLLEEEFTGTWYGHSCHTFCVSLLNHNIRKWQAFSHFNEPFRPCNKPF